MNIYNIGRSSVDDKKEKENKSEKIVRAEETPPIIEDSSNVILPVEIENNPIQLLYEATVRAMENIKINPKSDIHEPFYVHPSLQREDDGLQNYFETIRIDTGQFERILLNDNYEYDIAFPALFVRFVNIRYLVAQQRIGEGRATMRLRFILNNLNNEDPIVETMPFRIMQLINTSIQKAKVYEDVFDERVNLLYNDMPERTNMLQSYWVDYEVWFRDMSGWAYNDYVEKHIVLPPFTNHSDAPELNKDGHDDHKKPTYPDSSTII